MSEIRFPDALPNTSRSRGFYPLDRLTQMISGLEGGRWVRHGQIEEEGPAQERNRYTLNPMTPWADYKKHAYSFWAARSTWTLRDKTWTKEGRSQSKNMRWKPDGIGQQFPFPKSKMTFTWASESDCIFHVLVLPGGLVMTLLDMEHCTFGGFR